jgi:hypothetical protein
MADITDPRKLNTRRERSYPRVVKRGRHNSYHVKKPGQHGKRHDAPATIKLVNPVFNRENAHSAALPEQQAKRHCFMGRKCYEARMAPPGRVLCPNNHSISGAIEAPGRLG